MMRGMSEYTIMVGDTAYCAPSGWDWKKVCNALVEVGFKLWMDEKVRPEDRSAGGDGRRSGWR